MSHFPRRLWLQLCRECPGASGPVKGQRRTQQFTTGNMTHAVRYNDDVVQTLDFASLEQLRYLAQLLGHCTFNMYPREPRPRPNADAVFTHGDLNVVHPTIPGTRFRLKYNYSLSTLTVATVYAKLVSLTAAEAQAYAPAAPPAPSGSGGSKRKRRSSNLELDDADLEGQHVDVGQATYEVTNDPVWCLLLVCGTGPSAIPKTRAEVLGLVRETLR